MKRENGFYWVKDNISTDGIWTIAEWEDGRWCVSGAMGSFEPDLFAEIDENQLTHA